MSEELKPCPFCGATQHITTAEGSTFRWMRAECGECGAHGPEIPVQTLGDGAPDEWQAQGAKDAITEWNRRTDPLAASHQRLKEALELIAAIEDRMVGGDWEEIEEARSIAREVLKDAP